MATYQHYARPKQEAQDSLLAEQYLDHSASRDVSPYPRGYPPQSRFSEGFREPSHYAGGYYQREGYIPSTPTANQKRSMFYLPDSRWTWSFFLIVMLQAAIGLALEG